VDLPCKKSDVDNGRRKQLFEKHSTPNTKRVREMLDDIKRLVFPDLVIEDFLPTKSELNLDSVQYKECELSQRMNCVYTIWRISPHGRWSGSRILSIF